MSDVTPTRIRRGPERWLIWTIAGSVVAAALVVVLVMGQVLSVAASADDVAPHLDQRTARLLEYDALTHVHEKAPAFTLTDQHGRPMSLSSYRGEAVVLSFNDDECTDLCTLLAQDVRVANNDLGQASSKIAWVSINTNPYYPSSADVAQWTDQHGLGSASNWHFGTGSPAALSALAKAYGVPIDLDASTKTVTHGAELFFISPSGVERAIGQFGTESADTSAFGHGLAQAADDLLPASQQEAVAGAGVPATTSGGTEIGATPSPVTLSSLTGTGRVSTSADRGRYTVLNFWSSSCAACVRELPALEAEHRALGSSVAFYGVDVSDPAKAGRAFAESHRVTYPLGADTSGAVAGAFQVTGLPFTVILGPSGKVVIRHPGAMTREQLDYLLRTLDTSLPAG
ncbi:redoxin domain-containing protein [Frondihabitans australicus]|uniref:Cytochrome oxidase Cu insertion factor (SCO1/SenC/PrrC family) n=1 Tax=Frondihabitans australicus TaxID=386892 RepID=A0A495IH00_9MICO|nr:redoxin domain-containing protein [Frondihabitans australicus]RKR74425.1 cytochrome oxidase Cu insertion factor (SCO1/SenC/PrrC family) [Frondihabitans australicus]